MEYDMDDLEVVKYKKKTENDIPAQSRDDLKPNFIPGFFNGQSPARDANAMSQYNGSFLNSTPWKNSHSSSKRLSEFTSEKKARKQSAPIN